MSCSLINGTSIQYELSQKCIEEAREISNTKGKEFAKKVASSLGRNFELHTKLKNACKGALLNITLYNVVKFYFLKLDEEKVKFVSMRIINK